MREVGYLVALVPSACEVAQQEGVAMAIGSRRMVIPAAHLLEDSNSV